jgi:hypothetical protein
VQVFVRPPQLVVGQVFDLGFAVFAEWHLHGLSGGSFRERASNITLDKIAREN